jgi:hypothetical protein
MKQTGYLKTLTLILTASVLTVFIFAGDYGLAWDEPLHWS